MYSSLVVRKYRALGPQGEQVFSDLFHAQDGERNGTGVPRTLEQKARVIHQAESISQDRLSLNQVLQIRHGLRRQIFFCWASLVCHRFTSSFGDPLSS